VGPFAEHILPAVLTILDHGPISLLPHTADHKLRFTLLDLLHRLPFTDAMRPFLPALHALLLKLIKQDSEEVALLAVKTVMDIYRSFDKEQLEPHAQSCLETIKECFASMASVVADTFDAETEGKGPPQPDAAPVTPGPQAPQPLPVGLRSFKVLAECPIVIVFLFQSYRDLVAVETQAFVPIIFDFLQLQPAAQGRARREAEARGELFTDVCVELQSRRDEFSSLLLAQVKAISFAAYTFRVGGGAFAPYRNAIPDIVIRMLKDFPTESTANRKELLVALRHVLASEFRNSFIPYTDTLLDERVLIGQGITAHEHLRQIAYGMIADYVHHIRADLTMAQLSKVVHAHGCIMHDLSLPFTIHSMCSKLLLNLVGSVLNKNVDEASEMLHRVMEITVRKVESLAIVRSEWERWMRPKEYRDTPEGRVRKPPSNEPPKSEPLDDIDIERQRPIGAIYAMAEPEPDSIKGEHLEPTSLAP
jgi:transformation/transcription domain-associated protein